MGSTNLKFDAENPIAPPPRLEELNAQELDDAISSDLSKDPNQNPVLIEDSESDGVESSVFIGEDFLADQVEDPVPPEQPVSPPIQSDSDPRQTNKQAGNAIAFMTSLVAHTSFLLVLACWIYTAGKPSQGLLLNAEVGNSESTALDQIETFELAMDPIEEHVFESEPEFAMDVKIESPVSLQGIGDATTLTSASLDTVVENLRTRGNGRGASFFGAYAEGNRFVYVLDSSRSMDGDRWVYACNQLIDSLNGLKEGQEFLIICFDMQTTFLFNKAPNRSKYYTVGDDTIKRVRNWLRSRTLGRATMPLQALKFAINFNPDAIFLLSDGELQDDSRNKLRRINSNASEFRQIPIHTVHLFSRQGRYTLQQIAKENAGTFTPIEEQRGFDTFRRR